MPDPLLAIFSDVLGVADDALDDETSPDNTTEWDSLAAIELVSAIERAFDVRLSAREIMKMQTVGLARSVLVGKGAAGL